MSSARRKALCLLFAAFCLTPVFMMLQHRERWPFSDYHMYSNIAEPQFEYCLVIGETTDGAIVDLTFGKHWPPFEPIRLTVTLRRFHLSEGEDAADRQKLVPAMGYLRDLYVRQRDERTWTGPALRRLGLCHGRVDLAAPGLVVDRLAPCRPIADAWVDVVAANL